MYKRVSFIGAGNMGGALIRAACRVMPAADVIITDVDRKKADELSRELGCTAVLSNVEACETGDVVVLCLKPGGIPAALKETAPVLKKAVDGGAPKLLASVAAGVSSKKMTEALGIPGQPVIRVMPNTPALVGSGLMVVQSGVDAPVPAMELLLPILAVCGRVEYLDEAFFDQATAVASCSPAFTYMFIEALADGAVRAGLSREAALCYAAEAVKGSADMVLKTGEHPGALKDAVCSPGGSTIAGVGALERGGFRGSVMDAVAAAYLRNLELGEGK